MGRESIIMVLALFTILAALGWGIWEYWWVVKDQKEGNHSAMKPRAEAKVAAQRGTAESNG